MISTLLGWLSTSLESKITIACLSSFVWGILSILLSPCHLSSIPLVVGFIDGQGRVSVRRAFLLATLFAIGILITIGIIGVVTGLTGKMLGDIGSWGNYLVAVILFIVGLYLLEIVNLPFLNSSFHAGFKKKDCLLHSFWDWYSESQSGPVPLLIWHQCLGWCSELLLRI